MSSPATRWAAGRLYMYGTLLPKGERGQVDAALGKSTSVGTVTSIPPTDSISKTGETRTIDGVEIEFQMAKETEAPAELLMHFPQFRALCAAEDATHTLHNLYTLRGAQVRTPRLVEDAERALEMFGDKTDVVFAQHHWPTWGRRCSSSYLKKQRDLYKYIHDQSLRLMNQGYTMLEIAEMLKLPPSLERSGSTEAITDRSVTIQGGVSEISWLVRFESCPSESPCRRERPRRNTSSSWAGPRRW